MSTYTITASMQVAPDEFNQARISVRATSHFQHICNEAELRGVSKAGAARLARFFASHQGHRITVDVPHSPRLISWV